jgi:hypothetical protein
MNRRNAFRPHILVMLEASAARAASATQGIGVNLIGDRRAFNVLNKRSTLLHGQAYLLGLEIVDRAGDCGALVYSSGPVVARQCRFDDSAPEHLLAVAARLSIQPNSVTLPLKLQLTESKMRIGQYQR